MSPLFRLPDFRLARRPFAESSLSPIRSHRKNELGRVGCMPIQRLVIKLVMAVAASGVLRSVPAATQVSAAKEKAALVRITQGPEIERADPEFAIVRWTSNNPGGSPEHYGVVHYGTDPTKLDQTVKSPIRLNPTHSYTVFRVRLDRLKPATTYYYKVDAMEANGNSDGLPSPVRQFTTPR